MTRLLRDLVHPVLAGDRMLLTIVGVLCLIGLVAVYDAGSFRAEARSSTDYLFRFAVRMAIGWGALVVAARFPYRRLREAPVRWGLILLGTGLVVATVGLRFTGLVGERSGAGRWILLVQPVEIAKLAVVLHLAHALGPGWDRVARTPRRVIEALALPGVTVAALALQPNYGNAVVLTLLTVYALVVAGLPKRWLAVSLGGAAGLALLGVAFVHRISYRVHIWLDSLLHGDVPYQVRQGLIAMGSGGVTGQGVGGSHQRLAFLPDAHTDFIFAVIGEETGLIGAAVVLALFGLLAHRGYAIARGAGDGFGRLLAGGVTTMLLIYAMINLGMVTGLLPVMGLPLPFISYGGSALVTNLAAVGVLINIDGQKRDMNDRLRRLRRS
ncbi:MAG TPA: FtsW/RodA/SpoVE family cell cycle protein [Candidatus Krumholzibacteria bacterium]|nr:FtsW/RodA/SpoVE family cell cycle protein [Candidatus Krumholzibacteria bacterium]HRX50043.1 FtsW/RodA/SpoVE family cell cycle protein [Candidatus Krumholzibacteria bacterium]